MDSSDYRAVVRVMEGVNWQMMRRGGSNLSLQNAAALRAGMSSTEWDGLVKRWAGKGADYFFSSLTEVRMGQRLEQSRQGLTALNFAGESDQSVQGVLLRTGLQKRKNEAPAHIRHALFPSPFGECLAAWIGSSICWMSFVDDGDTRFHLARLQRIWPLARIEQTEEDRDREQIRQIFTWRNKKSPVCQVVVSGTPFQFRVWRALTHIPLGTVLSYQDLAALCGNQAACRAVAGAVAANPVSYLIPCHRVIRKSGKIHSYAWGESRKKVMLGWEACQS